MFEEGTVSRDTRSNSGSEEKIDGGIEGWCNTVKEIKSESGRNCPIKRRRFFSVSKIYLVENNVDSRDVSNYTFCNYTRERENNLLSHVLVFFSFRVSFVVSRACARCNCCNVGDKRQERKTFARRNKRPQLRLSKATFRDKRRPSASYRKKISAYRGHRLLVEKRVHADKSWSLARLCCLQTRGTSRRKW